MKSLKIVLSLIALALVASVPLQAQGKKGQKTPEQQLESINTTVNGSLTDAQKTKITAIFEASQQEMKGVPKEERKDKMPDMMKKQRAEIRAVLTPEQQTAFDAANPSGGKKGGKKKGGN